MSQSPLYLGFDYTLHASLYFRMSGVIDVAVEMELCTAPDYHPVDTIIV
jgi:hypothetical protein